jgi:hypothetical protein
MPKPDYKAKSDATPGEWKALLAPMLATADRAEDVCGYVVIGLSGSGEVELRTNMPDETVRAILLLVMPEVARA